MFLGSSVLKAIIMASARHDHRSISAHGTSNNRHYLGNTLYVPCLISKMAALEMVAILRNWYQAYKLAD